MLSPKAAFVRAMFDRIAPRYDLLNRILSFRQDVRWRRVLADELPPAPTGDGGAIDVACGTGDMLFELVRRRRDYQSFRGFDISEGMLAVARNRSQKQRKLSERRAEPGFCFSLELGQAESLPLPDGQAHALTIAFGIRNVDDRAKALREFFRVLRPGGRLAVLELFEADPGWFASVYQFYFNRWVPWVGRVLVDRAAYRYLPASVGSMPPATEFDNMLRAAGFSSVRQLAWLSGGVRLFMADK